jgi:hypothetical protein
VIVLERKDLDLIVDALHSYHVDRGRMAAQYADLSNDVHEPVFERAHAIVRAAEAFDDSASAGELADRILPLIARRR